MTRADVQVAPARDHPDERPPVVALRPRARAHAADRGVGDARDVPRRPFQDRLHPGGGIRLGREEGGPDRGGARERDEAEVHAAAVR